MSNNNEPKATQSMCSNTPNSIQDVWRALSDVKDPCNVLSGHDLSIVDMGLINRVETSDDWIEIGITFTEPGCVFGYRIIEDIEDLTAKLSGVSEIRVVPEPFPLWDESRLSLKAREVYANKKAQFGQPRFAGIPIRSKEERP